MGMLSTLSRVWRQGQAEKVEDRPVEIPVQIDLHTDEDDVNDETALATALDEPAVVPRNRQELLKELQKNYAEVVTLVRKVDGHLDTQERRGERLMDVVDDVPSGLDALREIRTEASGIARDIQSIHDLAKASNESSNEVRREQLAITARVQELIERSGETELRVAQTLDEFKGSLDAMTNATGHLGRVLEGIHADSKSRDDRLSELIEHNQRWMTTVLVLCAVCVGLAMIMAVASMF